MYERLTRSGRIASVTVLVAVVLCALPIAGVRSADIADVSVDARETIKVSVGIPPLAYLVERIGDARVSVSTLLVAGQDPHTFEPTPRQIVGLTGADMYFSVGLPFEERMLAKIQGSGAPLKAIEVTEGSEHEHHVNQDPHIWLSPAHLENMAGVVAGALAAHDPGHSAVYEQNLEKLCSEIRNVGNAMREILEPFTGREFLTYHSVLSHIAQEFGLTEVSIEEEGKSPGARALANIIERARSSRIRVVFTQPQFDDTSAKLIAGAIGGSIASIDPLDRDVLANLLDIAQQLALAME